MPRLTLRIDFDGERAIGPGKIKLLELIEALGSIAAAGDGWGCPTAGLGCWSMRSTTASANRWWPRNAGGAHGGGAALTPSGCAVVRHYRAVEAAAHAAGAMHIEALARALAEPGGAVDAVRSER
jgi:molybdate transport system regulatory protein